MAEPFDQRAPSRDGLFSRLFGPQKQTSAIREIEELLARARRIRDVPAERIAEIAARHGQDVKDRLRTGRKNLYRRFLEHCLLDGTLSEDENAELSHLRSILRLNHADAAAVHDDVAVQVYGEAVEQVLRDHRLDPDERGFLERLRSELRLDPEVAGRLYERGAAESRQRFLSRTLRYENVLVSAPPKLDLTGTSERSLEDAVRAALEEASRAVPELKTAEIQEIRTDLENGRIARWHVRVTAGLPTPE